MVKKTNKLFIRIVYEGYMIEKMLEIPKDMQRSNALKLCVLLALTAMLYMLIASEFAEMAEVVTSQRVIR